MARHLNGLLGLRSKSRRIAAAVLIAYLSLLVQPCAMAMEQGPLEHPAACNESVSQTDSQSCLSQPASECTVDDLNFDKRDSGTTQFVPSLAPLVIAFLIIDDGQSAQHSFHPLQAPPSGEPSLAILNCVYLK